MRRKPIFALTSHSDGRTARRVLEGPWLTPETKRFQAYFGIKESAIVTRHNRVGGNVRKKDARFILCPNFHEGNA